MTVAKFQVCGKIEFIFDIDVEENTEDEAELVVKEMDYSKLIENAPMPNVVVESVVRLRARKRG
jgi:hypothetical protein